MGAKKRSTAVDRQQRSGQVKTRLAANKSGSTATPNKKPQKVNPKTASKKSLPIKKRISNEKSAVEEVKEPKSRSNSKSKKPENEPSTSTDASEERKSIESSPEVETDSKQTAKDGKTKAISKMLKSLDIQISGFANILPPEEKIIEVLKSSISENVKTKSRAAAVKVNNSGAIGSKSGGRKEQQERKSAASISSSVTNSPSTSADHETKTSENKLSDAGSKKEASPVNENEKPVLNEVQTTKDPIEPIESKAEEPVVETKKKIAAKKAKLEASRNKKKVEEHKDEPKPEIAVPTDVAAANEPQNPEQPKDEVESDKKKPIKSVKGAKQTSFAEREQPAGNPESETTPPEAAPQKPLPKAAMSPKKSKQITKVTKGKCNEDETKVPEALVSEKTQNVPEESNPNAARAEEAAEASESNQEGGESIDVAANSAKTTKALTIRQRLQNKYKMTPVKSKPPAKPTKKGESKSTAKKPPTKNQDDEKKNDIYDFKSGSESEENIKMELPTLKQLREFSDDDDKPLQVAKKKLKEDAKCPEAIVPKPEPKVEPPKVEKKDIKPPPKASAEKKPTKTTKKPPAKSKPPPPESSSDEKSSSTSDSEDEQKLSTFGQKRHRMASLNALAKVQCLYENESRTAYELGLSKTVQVMPKIRTLNSESSSEDEKDVKVAIKAEPTPVKEPKKETELKVEPVEECAEPEKEEEVEVETKRELRNVPGRGMGKHWEFESDTDNEAVMIEKLRLKKKKLQKLKALQAKKEKKDKEKAEEKLSKPKKPVKPPKKCVKVKAASSDDGSSESSDHEDKKKPMNPPAEKPPAEPKKKRKRELKEELIGDYKGILARKRMASLNASAIVAATYEVERHLDRNFASDCSSFESFPEEEKHVSKKSKKHVPPQPQQTVTLPDVKETKEIKDTKDTTDIKVDVSECVDTKESSDFKDAVKEAKETTRPTSSSLLIVQDTDVTITGVYVNPTTGSSQEAYCKMQYRVQSSVTEERVLRPGSVEPPKSYTPLGALSSMRPPGAAPGSDGRSTPPTPVTAVPPTADSINHPNIYQPNDLSHHDPSEHSHYSYHHHMSPSGMSMHPHSADHASQMHHYGGHQPSAPPPPPPQAPSAHHYHSQQQQPPPTSMSQGRCDSPVRYTGSYQGQHPTLSMTAGGGSSAFCAPPSLQQQQQLQHQQHHDMSGKFIDKARHQKVDGK